MSWVTEIKIRSVNISIEELRLAVKNVSNTNKRIKKSKNLSEG